MRPEHEKKCVRLVETRGRMQGTYACLSYCWGASETQIGQTTIDNLSRHIQGIPFEELPETIVDAIRLCSRLGFRYLWIDRLCIVQDDINDWYHEASRMCEVYSRSSLTISVPICTTSSQSFLAEREKGFREGPQFSIIQHKSNELGLKSGSWLYYNCSLRHQGPWFLEDGWSVRPSDRILIPENHWLTRGWTFQEWMLSPRVLHIESMTMWDCFEGYANELNVRNMKDAHLVRDPKEFGNNIPWEAVVEEYSRRRVTRDEDRVPALAGLAARYAQVTGHTYLAGLWLEDMPQCLLWTSAVPMATSPNIEKLPSWSWATSNGRVTFRNIFKPLDANMSISSTLCQFNPPGSFAAVEKAWIDIEGRLGVVSEGRESDASTRIPIVKVGDKWWKLVLDVSGILCPAVAKANVYVLLVCSMTQNNPYDYRGLVVQECGWQDGRQCFKRLGVASLSSFFEPDLSPHPWTGPSWDARAIRLI